VLSGTPVVSLVNCVLCGWLWAGAIFAVFLYRKFSPENPSLSVGQGALVGLLMAVIAAVISGIISFFTTQATMDYLLPYIDSVVGDQLGGMGSYLTQATGFSLFSLVCNLFVYGIFGILGGVIATGLIWKEKQPV
jgi:hypothetical protein